MPLTYNALPIYPVFMAYLLQESF